MRVGITGISGSLGTALTARLVAAGIGPIVGVTRDELRAEQISQRYGGIYGQVRCMVVAEGINNTARLVEAFRGCEVLIHAAAFKRIGGSVYASEDMVRTNVAGTLSVLKAATEAGVGKVLVISSDKAVQSTNLYGSTKFVAECLAIQENSFAYPRNTRISCARYGNVIGSRGSVVPLWAAQARINAPLAVTHAAMTRFLITMDQAVDFVMSCVFSMLGGEIFVPLLPAASMIDVAEAVRRVHQSTSEIIVKGELRPGGEKLAEALLSEEEPVRTVRRRLHGGFSMTDAYVILPSHRSWSSQPYPGDAISADTVYRSDTASPRLTVEQLIPILEGVA